MNRTQTLLIALAAAAAGFAAPASATPITESFTLDTWRGSGSVSGNNFGTVTLTQNGTDVAVNLTLTNTATIMEGFVGTGAGDALDFYLNLSSISITGLTTGFTALNTTGSSFGAGKYAYGIDCSGCGNGGSNMLAGPLDFTIQNITLDDFISKNGNYFLSDICVGAQQNGAKFQCTGTPGVTGPVSAEFDAPGGGSVPEPVTLSLFGAGLVGAVGLRRRRKA